MSTNDLGTVQLLIKHRSLGQQQKHQFSTPHCLHSFRYGSEEDVDIGGLMQLNNPSETAKVISL